LRQHRRKADGDDYRRVQLETGALLGSAMNWKKRLVRYTDFVGLVVCAIALAISRAVGAQPVDGVSHAIEKIRLPNGQEAWFSAGGAVPKSDQLRHYDIPGAPFVDALTIWFQQSKAQLDVLVFSPREMEDVKLNRVESGFATSLEVLQAMVSCTPVTTSFVPRGGSQGLVLRFRPGKAHCAVALMKVERIVFAAEQERALHDYDIRAGEFGPSVRTLYQLSAPELHVELAPEPVDAVDRALFHSVHTRAIRGRMSAAAAFDLLWTDSRVYATTTHESSSGFRDYLMRGWCPRRLHTTTPGRRNRPSPTASVGHRSIGRIRQNGCTGVWSMGTPQHCAGPLRANTRPIAPQSHGALRAAAAVKHQPAASHRLEAFTLNLEPGGRRDLAPRGCFLVSFAALDCLMQPRLNHSG
jgi:hypothetical protein